MFGTSRIGVHLLDQLDDAVDAVAQHLGRLAAGCRDHAVADHQQTIIVARGELLDQNLLALQPRRLESTHDLLASRKIGGHAAPLVSVLRLDDHRHADLARGTPCVFHVADRAAARRRNPDRAEHHARHFLVLCNRLGDRAGPIGLGGLDATLLPAVAEQHQAVVVQPAIRYASFADDFDDGSRAGAKAHFVGEIPQPLDFSGDVERAIEHGRQQELAGDGKALAAHRFVGILDDDAINATFRRFAGLAEPHLGARKRLEFQGNVLEDVAEIGAVSQALKEPAPHADAATMLDHRGHPAHQPVVESREFVRWLIQFAKINPRL